MIWTSALTTLQFSAIAWVATRAPLLGTLASRGEFAELDRVFKRVATVSFALLAGAGLFLIFCVSLFNAIKNWTTREAFPAIVMETATNLADRMLEPLPTALLTVGVVLNHIPMCLSIYVRAHKDDPLIWWTTLSNILVGLLVWALGSRYGAIGAAWAYLGVVALVSVPGAWMVFQRSRRKWRAT
jgi:hypothetical protein